MGGPTGHREARSPGGRLEVADRLRGRRVEIEDAIGARAFAVAELTGTEEPGYREGLRAAIAAAVEYALEAIESGIRRSDAVPVTTLVQARVAARSGVGLSVVLRRYAAGYSVLGDSLGEELRRTPGGGHLFGTLQGEVTAAFERLITEVSAEYEREADQLSAAPMARQALRVRSLLEGESVHSAELGYELSHWHVAAVADGAGAGALLRQVVRGLERPFLVVDLTEWEAWAWLGGKEAIDPALLVDRARGPRESECLVAVGEPGREVSGWRASHRQAMSALSVALRDPRPATRYGDVALLSTVLADEDLTAFLTDAYLRPLADVRGGGGVLCATLRAFLAAGRNASSAAAALGIARQTVTSRVRVIEERLGRPIDGCAAELELALRIAPFLGADVARYRPGEGVAP